jgi:hypothetical protein
VDAFPSNKVIDDPTWLLRAGRERWVVITKDKHIRHRQNELQTLIRARVSCFVIASGEITAAQQADAVVTAIPAMRRYVQTVRPPFVVRIDKGGRTERLA